jgi:hypothetical protein
MMYKHNFDNTILRSYDIRGIYEKTLNNKDAFMLGYFFWNNCKEEFTWKKEPINDNWNGRETFKSHT